MRRAIEAFDLRPELETEDGLRFFAGGMRMQHWMQPQNYCVENRGSAGQARTVSDPPG